MKIRDKINNLRKRFKYISKHRYLYNKKADLNLRSNHIICFLFIRARERGVFVMRLRLGSVDTLSVNQWSKYWIEGRKTSRGKKLPSLIKVVNDKILVSISETVSREYPKGDVLQLLEIIGWHITKRGKI